MVKVAQIGLIIFIIAIFYGSTLSNGFVHDDVWQVQQNRYLPSINNLGKLFTTCIAEDILGGCEGKGFYYRPMQYVVYLIVYQLSSAAWVFHLTNLVLLAGLGILIFEFSKVFLANSFASWITTIIFLIHPVNSEVVNWISATPELLVSIGTLAMFLAYVQYAKNKNWQYLFLSAGCYLIALLSKETAVFLWLLIPGYYYLYRPNPNQKFDPGWAIYLGPLAGYLGLRSAVLGRIVYQYQGWHELTLGQQMASAIGLLSDYLKMLVFPWPLSLQHHFVPTGLFDEKTLIGGLLLAAIVWVAVMAYQKNNKTVVWGLGIFMVALAPVLIFINKLGEFPFSERYLFFPAIGFAIISAEIISRLRINRKVVGIAGLSIFILCWRVIFERNKDWQNNEVSFRSILKVNPQTKNEFNKQGLGFKLPPDWQVAEAEETLVITDPSNKFQIQVFSGNLAQKQESFGRLLQQGPARIPNTDSANVKVWEAKEVLIMEFTVIKNNRSLRILVRPANSPLMKEFDEFISSMSL